jgi:hypothetical protein
MPLRRFPPPWIVQEQAMCFIVKDRAGQNLAYVYFRSETFSAKLLSPAEAHRIAIKIASLAQSTLSKIDHATSS